MPLYVGGVYQLAGQSSMHTALMAINEVNQLTDLLPSTVIKYQVYNTEMNTQTVVKTSIDLIHSSAFSSRKTTGVIGAYSSAVTIAANSVFKIAGIPQVSHASSSPDLSDNDKYPTFFR